MLRRSISCWLTCLTVATALCASDELDQKLKRIFSTNDFQVKSFGPARWIEAGAAYTTVEDSAAVKDGHDIVRYDTATGARQVLVSAAKLVPAGASKALDLDDYSWSADGKRMLIFTDSKKVWRQNTRGDYWVLERATGQLKRLGRDAVPSSLMFAKFSPDGTRVAYVRDRDIYVEDVRSGSVRRLTAGGWDTHINGTSDWVYEEELNLRDGFRWSADSTKIAYWQFDSTGVQKFALINNTDSLYPAVKYIPYPKVGTINSAVRVGVVSASGGATKWMAVPGDPRSFYIFRMDWIGKSQELAIGQLNRLQNTAVIYVADSASGKCRNMFQDHDEAWVDVAENDGQVAAQAYQWLNSGQEILWLSERDGWRHAYVISRSGAAPRLLTTGPSDVVSLEATDPEGRYMYYMASPSEATRSYLFRAPLDNSRPPEQLTPASQPGTHHYDLSPDCRWALHTWSRFDQPPVTELVKLPEHQTVRTLEDNAALRTQLAPLLQPAVEFLQVKVSDGTMLDAWMLKPANFDPSRKYPMLVYVYGEPAAVTVADSWGGNRNLFHRAMALEGYLVVSFDNRGTPAPKGRAWRKSIYGTVGVLSTKDQTEAVAALARDRSYVDLKRVAVWGWSGGGTNTLNLMFRSPDTYQVGVSVAPVPQQKLYDTIYQERYMGLPDSNAKGYQEASAIHFAEGLKGKLLVVHGSGDDNVHMQGTQLLINRLVELGKPFDFMEYPNRTHAISEGKGTSLHLYSLIARYIEDHLPAGAR